MKKPAFILLVALSILVSARTARAEGYLLNMYHFNLQYVAGNERAMREGVETGLEPLLDVYLRHPAWKADFELQGMFVEYLADHYPAVLAKLKKLADNGQAEIVSFHYSDQLFLAFPALDEERSLQLNQEIFTAHGLPLSGIVFTQEAQFGEGMCALAKKHGFRAAVMTANSYNWFQSDPGLPVFSCRDFLVVKSADPDVDPMIKQEWDWAGDDLKVKWYFVGDGELVVTGGASPYSLNFRPKPDLIKKMEENFAALAAEGYRTATVSEWLDAVAAHNLAPRPLRLMLDAAWRPQDDQGLFTWLGKHEFPWENDRQVRTQNYEARSWLVAAEAAGISWDRLAPLWRLQLEAEVSDSTGWYPTPGELRYSRSRSKAVIAGVKELCPACLPGRFPATLRSGVDTALLPAAEITGAWWSKVEYFNTDWPGLTALKVAMIPGGDGRITFKIAGDVLAYCPAFIEREVVHIPFADIKPVLHYVGLPNGLIGLGPNRWLIRDNRAGFVGAGIDTGARTVDFRIKNRPGRLYRFTFFVFDGHEQAALKLANEINQTGQ